MKRTIRFMLRYVLLPLMILAAIPTVMLIQDGYELYAQALEECPVQEMAERIESKPDYTPVDELPQIYLDAVISVEDHRFYSHPGVDLLAIGRAAFNDLRTLSFAEGGSTITQQLAKNEYFTQEKTLTRKIAEVFMALKIERELDKDTILSLYVNSINFGSGYETVAAASWGYFGKESFWLGFPMLPPPIRWMPLRSWLPNGRSRYWSACCAVIRSPKRKSIPFWHTTGCRFRRKSI